MTVSKLTVCGDYERKEFIRVTATISLYHHRPALKTPGYNATPAQAGWASRFADYLDIL